MNQETGGDGAPRIVILSWNEVEAKDPPDGPYQMNQSVPTAWFQLVDTSRDLVPEDE